MEQIDRPDLKGGFKLLAQVATVAGLAYTAWSVSRSVGTEDGSFLTTENAVFAALLIVAIVLGLYRDSKPDRFGVRLGTREVLVRSTSGSTQIPLHEATVRLVKEDRSTRTKTQNDTNAPLSRTLFIEHSGEQTEVDISGMLPAQIETYAEDIAAAFTDARWKLGLPEPGSGELEA